MNEMKLLEDMCAAVPAPGADRLAAVRARVLDGADWPARPGRSRPGRGRASILAWRRLALAGAAAAAAAAVAVLAVAGLLPFAGRSLAPRPAPPRCCTAPRPPP